MSSHADTIRRSIDYRSRFAEKADDAIDALLAENQRLRDALEWLDMALGWAVFKEERRVWTSNEMRDIKQRIRAALDGAPSADE